MAISAHLPRRVAVYGMLFLASVINYVDRVNLSVAGSLIAAELDLSPSQLGWLFSGFLWSYILLLVPAGRLADRLDFRYLAPLAISFWSVANAATAVTTSIAGLLATRILLGVGEAAVWPVGTRTIRAWAPRSEYGVAIPPCRSAKRPAPRSALFSLVG